MFASSTEFLLLSRCCKVNRRFLPVAVRGGHGFQYRTATTARFDSRCSFLYLLERSGLVVVAKEKSGVGHRYGSKVLPSFKKKISFNP